MTLTKEQIQELEEVAKPLVRWVRDNCHPHCEVVVTQVSVEAKEGLANVNLTKFEPLHYV